ncbi:hypothetical protein DYBT9275_04428 [Dyadobacter sp. CECT 9275]|uniref:VWFD domain-containing protein n=1 Tax=Dyadobacter helix TaxID=2822344 RepID=A0A916JFD8_9BACT|nr:VWD domain-containing protein [Dyadobacter sp. CECT 9275]CAG5009125.1 hypothetical protein DYBT9275_04428 [Dyadobacter sp. CECT 9275]
MKKYLRISLSLVVFAATVFWPTACKRIVEVPAEQAGGDNIVDIHENVYVLDSNQNNQLLELTPSYLLFKSDPQVGNGHISVTAQMSSLRTGDILLGYISEKAPRGFAAEITRIIDVAGNIRMEYKFAPLNKIFKRIHKTFEFTFGTESLSAEFPLSLTTTGAGGVTSGTVEGKIAVSGEYQGKGLIEIFIEDSNWKKFKVKHTIDKKFNASASLKGSAKAKFEKNLLCKELNTKVFLVFGIPVMITPVVRLDAGMEFDGSAKVEGNIFSLNHSSATGKEWNKCGGPSCWQDINEENPQPDPAPVSLEIKGKVEASIEGKMEDYFYQFFDVDCEVKEYGFSVGVGMKFFGGFEGACSTLQKGLNVIYYFGVELKAFVDVKLLDLIEATPTISYDWKAKSDPWALLSELCGDEPDPVPDNTEPVPTSISTGDPHITTLDRARYSFMAVGEFVALKSTTDKFEVQARQQEVASKNNSGQVSFNTGVAVNTGNDVVCVYPPNRITVNKQAISFDFENYALSNGGSIRKDGSQLYIRNANGDQVEVRLFAQDLDYYITLNINRKSKVKGIIGNYDGNAANDLVTSTGQAVANNYQSLYPVFADSWRIKQAESLFIYDSGKSTESYTDRNFPRTQVNLTSAQEAAARNICAQQGVTDPVTLQNCITDVALTGDNSYAQRAEVSENNGALRNFSIGNFNNFRNDVGLYEATMSGEGVRFNDLNCSGSCALPAIYWKDKLDFSKGFETEMTFTATKVVATSNDNSLGVCGIETASSSSPSVYSTLLSGAFDSNAQKKTSTRVAVASGQVTNNGSMIANVFDGQRHRLRVVVSRSSAGNGFSGNYKIYLDGASAPAASGNFTQNQYFRNMLFPSLYGENVLVHSWTMKSLM